MDVRDGLSFGGDAALLDQLPEGRYVFRRLKKPFVGVLRAFPLQKVGLERDSVVGSRDSHSCRAAHLGTFSRLGVVAISPE